MNASEIRELPEKELLSKIQEIRERLFHMSFKAATEPVTNPAEVTNLRRDMARIEGVLRDQKLKSAPARERLSREVRTLKIARAARMKAMAAKKATVTAASKKRNQSKQGKAAKPPAGVKAMKSPATSSKAPVAEKKA